MSNGSWESIYIKQGIVQIEVLDSVINAVDIFKSHKYNRILDLGCGTGRHSIYLAQNGFKVYACDISQKAIDITRNLGIKYGLEKSIKLSLQNMFSLSYDNELFDAILCIWVQGHGTKKEIEKGVSESYRVLRKGGMIITDYVSTKDKTFGIGKEIEPNTFIGGRDGEEGIPHYYITESELREMYKEFDNVIIAEKVYSFKDNSGKDYKIDALVVCAVK
jgi:ubiquinone/menaquinone biosynthesis C-methylase UbiE